MAKIDIGGFGNITPGVAPIGDRSAMYDAAGRVGESISRLGEQMGVQQHEEDVARMRSAAANVHLDYELGVKNTAIAIKSKLESGDLAPEQAADAYTTAIGELPQPDMSRFDSLTQENVQHGMRAVAGENALQIHVWADAAKVQNAAANLDQGLDLLGKQAGLPGANVELQNYRGNSLAQVARSAGVRADVIERRLQGFKDQNWLNQATERQMANRDSIGGLRHLEHDLTAADGFYANRLDTDKRNFLLGHVLDRRSRLEDELMRQADRDAKQAGKDAEARALAATLAAGGLLDPKDGDHRQFVDSLFDNRVNDADVETGSAPWQVLAIDTATRTGIVPKDVGSWLRTSAMSADPLGAASAAHVLDAIRERNPQILDYVDDNTKAFALQVADMQKAGTPPLLSIPAVHKAVYETTPQEKKLYGEIYRRSVKDAGKSLQSMLGGDEHYNTSFFHRTPQAPDAMIADFDMLSERYATMTKGDVARAQMLAYQDLQSRWGRSEVNGHPEVMRYAPERFGVNPEEVHHDIAEYLAGNKPVPAAGMTQPGNLELWNRKVLKNADGSVSTTLSMSIGTDKGEVLIPTVIDGVKYSKADAIAQYRKTGENLGTFDSPEHADAYATALHNEQWRRMNVNQEEIAKRLPNISLVSDDKTETQAYSSTTGRPLPLSWAMIETDPHTGAIKVLPDRYTLPTPSDLTSKVQAERTAAIAKARARAQAEIEAAGATVEEARSMAGVPMGAAEQDRIDMRAISRARRAAQ